MLIRPARPEDAPALVALYARCFDRPIGLGHWRWKYAHPESGFLVEEAGAVVAHYGGVPYRHVLPDGPGVACQGADSMTAPEHRRRGLYTALVRAAHDRWRALGHAFVDGAPNENWGRSREASGWEPLFQVELLVRPLRPLAILRRRLGLLDRDRAGRVPSIAERLAAAVLDRARARRDPSVRVSLERGVGAGIDALWRDCAGDARIAIVRDAAWIRQRWLAAPDRDYALLVADRGPQAAAGYAVVRIEQRDGARFAWLADLLTRAGDEGAQQALLAAATALARSRGAEKIQALVPPATELAHALRLAGLRLARGTAWMQWARIGSALPLAFVADPRHWRVTGADFDFV